MLIIKKIKLLKKTKFDSFSRWTAAITGVLAALCTGSAVVSLQVWGWVFAFISSGCWFYAATADSDKPRSLMNCFYVIWSLIAIINWIRF